MEEKAVYYPLSNPQKGIWYTEKLYSDTSIGNIAGTVKIKKEVSYSLLEKAINTVIKINDSMRIRIDDQGEEPLQYVSEFKYTKLDYIDFSNMPLEELYKWDANKTQTPFFRSDSDLFYFALIKVNNETGGFYIKLHHLIGDGWTMVLVVNEIMDCYHRLKGEELIENAKPSYIDFVLSEQSYINSNRFLKDKEYWNRKYDIIPEMTTLKPRKTNALSTKAKRKTFVLPSKLSDRIHQYCCENKESVFSLFFSAMAIYVYRVTGKDEIIFGTPVLNRSNAKEKETTGMFVSTVPIRIKVDDKLDYASFAEAISREWMSTLRHQKYSYSLLLKDIRERNKEIDQLYDIVISYQNAKLVKKDEYGKLEGRWHFNCNQVESLNIHINDREDDGNIVLDYDYLSDLFYSKEIEFIHDHMIRILWHALDNPSRQLPYIEMISEKEKHKILCEFNNIKSECPKNKTIHQLFEEQAERTPDNVALVFEGKTMTYSQLNQKANQLAKLLRVKGVKPDDIIGLMIYRSFEMIIGMLAILKAGGAYLPIDPDYPNDRIRFMLEDSGTKLLLTHKDLFVKLHFQGQLLDIGNASLYQGDCSNLNSVNNHKDLVYIIYTSGSTGKPKGVMIEHKSLVNFIFGVKNILDFSVDSIVLSVTTMAFDIFVFENFTSLLNGGRVVLANDDEQRTPLLLKRLILKNGVNKILTTPSRMQMLINEDSVPGFLKNIKEIMLGGEVFSKKLWSKLREFTDAKIVNGYGPTEITIGATFKVIDKDGNINIGKPISNTQVYVLDKHLNIVPIGILGELCVGGEGLARGYLNRPELTAEKFVPSPFIPGERIYKTGDIVRWYPEGDIEYIGRLDGQVKINGYRIELAEIENRLLKYDGISEAVVIDRVDSKGNKYLCSYIVSENEAVFQHLRAYLLQELPSNMVPVCFVRLDKIPLTSNGKVDRKALPEPDLKTNLKTEYIAPRNKTEEMLSDIWSKILDVEEVGIEDNFFELGGDSLRIVQLLSFLYKNDIIVKVPDIYKNPTIRELSNIINANRSISDECLVQKSMMEEAACSSGLNEDEFVKLEKRQISDMILSGCLPTIDAAALCYFPDDVIQNDSDDLRNINSKNPFFYNYIKTGLGNVGIMALPISANCLYTDKPKVLELCMNAIKTASEVGAKVISLTGLIPSATGYGIDIANSCKALYPDVQVTTGHATTAASVILSVERLLKESGRGLDKERVCVLGLGSIGTAVIKLLLSVLPHPNSVLLCDVIHKKDELTKLRYELKEKLKFENDVNIVFSDGIKIPEEVYESTLVIGATNVPEVLNVDKLNPGTLIIDDSSPHCFSKEQAINRLLEYEDILFTEGGVLQSPEPTHKTIYLPPNINSDIMEKYRHHFLTSTEITGCILSSLLSVRFSQLNPTVGNIGIDDCCKHYEVLSQLKYNGALLHCNGFTIPEWIIDRFRKKFGDKL